MGWMDGVSFTAMCRFSGKPIAEMRMAYAQQVRGGEDQRAPRNRGKKSHENKACGLVGSIYRDRCPERPKRCLDSPFSSNGG